MIINKENFKKKISVGDRVVVRLINQQSIDGSRAMRRSGNFYKGNVIGKSDDVFSVEFDENIEGHECSGRYGSVKEGHCWNFFKYEMDSFIIKKIPKTQNKKGW